MALRDSMARQLISMDASQPRRAVLSSGDSTMALWIAVQDSPYQMIAR